MDLIPAEADDEEEIHLRPETMAILNEFLAEKNLNELADDTPTEDWQMSQFWYSDETSKTIVDECIAALDGKPAKIACISCPSLVPHFLQSKQFQDGQIQIRLFEFDRRFEQKFPDCFIFYDYNQPSNIPEEFFHTFDFIVADPPFLSDECFEKVGQTIRLLAKPDDFKLLFSTGSIMEETLQRLFKLKKTKFKPKHKNNLANEFSTFTSYEPIKF